VTARPRRSSQRDANQQEIVDGLRVCGYFVFDVSALCPWADLLVYGPDLRTHEDEIRLFEVKTPDGVLTDEERRIQQEYPGMVQTVRSLADALLSYGRC